MTKNIIKSTNNKIQISQIKSRAKRLLALKINLKEYFKKTSELDRKLPSNIEFDSLTYFTGKNDHLKEIEKILNINQYLYIHGISGCGKSTIALQYANLRLKKEKNLIVKCIDSQTLLSIVLQFQDLSSDLRIINYKKLNFIDLINELKEKLNSYLIRNNFRILFILENLVVDEPKNDYFNHLKALMDGFVSRVQFLITTKNSNLNFNLTIIGLEISCLNKTDCFEFINKKITNKKQLTKKELQEIFQKMELEHENKFYQ